MSIFPASFINTVAESIGIVGAGGGPLNEQVQSMLIEDAEYRIREVIHSSAKFMKHSKRRKLTYRDINSALAVKNVQPLYGYSIFNHEFHTTNFQNQQLYYVHDAEIDLEELVNAPLPAVPVEVTFTAHWLAIEGVQPKIVQNPTSEKSSMIMNKEVTSHTVKAVDTPIVKQVLTVQLQTYFEKITAAVQSTEERVCAVAFESLSQDPGIQALMPYFVVYICDQVTNNLKSLHISFGMMKTVQALISNPHLFLDPYLHQILPAVITCVVAKHLAPNDDHFSLRKMSADLLLTISQYSGATYPGLQARITKTLVRALLDQSKPPQTLFGAIYALWRMGPEVVDLLIVPNACALCSRVNLETAPETHKLIVQVLKGHFDRITSGSKDEASVKKWADVYGPFASFVCA